MKSAPNSERGAIPLFALVAFIGIIAFLIITNLADFKNSTFGQIFLKPFTQAAAAGIVFVDNNNNTITQTTSPTVRVKLNAPWPIAYAEPSLVKEAHAQTPNFLVANWRFDETAPWNNNCKALSVIDSSVNLINGMSCASDRGPTTAVVGSRGMARQFSGTRSFVKVADNAKLDFKANQNFSLSLWFKTDNTARSAFLLSKGGGDTKDTGYSLILLDGRIPTLALSRPRESSRFLLQGKALTDNNWHLITAVINRGGNAVLYVDGAVAASASVTNYNVDLSNNNPLAIGCYTTGSACFTGLLDDVRIYNTALTLADVTALYNGSNTQPSSAPTTQPTINPTSAPTPVPTASPTPVPALITQITISESADMSVNPVVINPVSANPTYTNYTFTNSSAGTKTLYARFASTTGLTQDSSATIQLVSATPIPTATSTSVPAPTPPGSYDKKVTDYGAKGDGSTDDTAAFNNAIAGTPSGGTLFVPKPANNYRINNTINVNKAIKIVGEGSTLSKSSGIVLFNITSSNVTIDNLRLMGPGNGGVAIYSETANLNNIVIQNNYIEGWLDGISLFRTTSLKISKNNIRHSQYAAIALTSTVGTYLGAGKPSVAELRSGADLTDRFSIVIDGNTIYDVKGNGGDGSRNGYGITISDDASLQPARALVVRNKVEYVNTWECYDTHAGKELYFLDNYCYMAMRAFNLSSDKRYTNKMTDVYAVRNTVVKGPQGPVPSGIGMPGDIFSSSGGGNYAGLESIVLVDSSSYGPAAGGVYDNKLFGFGFTGWAGIDVRDYNLAPVSGNICYESVTGDVNSRSKACP